MPPSPTTGGIYVAQGAMTLPGTAAASNTAGTTKAETAGESGSPKTEEETDFSDGCGMACPPGSTRTIRSPNGTRSKPSTPTTVEDRRPGAMSSGIEQELSIAQRNETYAKLADPDSRITVDQAGQEVKASRQQLGREIADDANTVKEAVVAGVDLTVNAIVTKGAVGRGRGPAATPIPRIRPGPSAEPLPKPKPSTSKPIAPDPLLQRPFPRSPFAQST